MSDSAFNTRRRAVNGGDMYSTGQSPAMHASSPAQAESRGIDDEIWRRCLPPAPIPAAASAPTTEEARRAALKAEYLKDKARAEAKAARSPGKASKATDKAAPAAAATAARGAILSLDDVPYSRDIALINVARREVIQPAAAPPGKGGKDKGTKAGKAGKGAKGGKGGKGGKEKRQEPSFLGQKKPPTPAAAAAPAAGPPPAAIAQPRAILARQPAAPLAPAPTSSSSLEGLNVAAREFVPTWTAAAAVAPSRALTVSPIVSLAVSPIVGNRPAFAQQAAADQFTSPKSTAVDQIDKECEDGGDSDEEILWAPRG